MSLTLSNSKLNTARRCWKLYEYKYVMGLRPKERRVQLERGAWIHELLMVWADGEDWRERHKRLTYKFSNLWEEEREELGDLPTECLRIMKAYLRTYKHDGDRYRIIDTELDETVTLPNGIKLRVIIDVVLEDMVDGGLWLKDYKTRKAFADADNLIIDPQLTLYFRAAEILGYTPIRGVMYDEIRTKPPAIPEVLRSGELSKRKNIDTDVFTYMSEIRRQGLNPDEYSDILTLIALKQKDRFFRRTLMPKDPPMVVTMTREAMMTGASILRAEEKQHFPRAFDRSCNWCDYKDLCITELHGGNIEPIIKMNFTTAKERDL